MPRIQCEFPVLVMPQKGSYRVRLLFNNHFSTEAVRFKDALEILIKRIKRALVEFSATRDNLEDLFWYHFNPKIHFYQQRLQFSLGQTYIDGHFAIAEFKIKEQKIAFLPFVDNKFLMLFSDSKTYGSNIAQIEGQVHEYLREQRKKEDYFSAQYYYASGKEFITTVDFYVNIKQDKFPFESSGFSFFALQHRQGEFDGAVEVNKVGQNWCDLYPDRLQRAILRDDIVNHLRNLIFSPRLTAIAVIGPSGAGRTTLLQEALYQQLQAHYQKPHPGKIPHFWHIDPTRIIAGMSIVGQWERRFEAILQFIKKRIDKRLRHRLFIDNVIALFRVGKSAGSDMTLSDVLKPYLEQRDFTLIIEASQEEWHKVQEMDRRFADLFEIVRINEASIKETASMVIKARKDLEQNFFCTIDEPVLPFLFKIQNTLLSNRAYPGNIIDFIQRVITKKDIDIITTSHIEAEIKTMTNLKAEFLDKELPLLATDIEKYLQQRLIGQPAAVSALTNVILLVKSALHDINKPIASMFFIGPTGVGKTQAAKELTRYLFEDESHLLRLDMNEFISPYDVERLIGSWRHPEGLLTSQVRYQPFTVLLLDEIEKAHASIHDLLLQVLGEGRLTDTLGRTTDFSRCIIILTSNLGAKQASKQLGFAKEDQKSQASSYKSAIEGFFRPEFINRIDDIVVFEALKPEDAIFILQIQLNDLLKRDGFLRRTTILNVSEKALQAVANKGFSQALGGRALKRAIEKELTLLAANQLASIPPSQAILMDIDWIDEHLKPRIIPLVPPEQSSAEQLTQLSLLKPDEKIITEILDNLHTMNTHLYQKREAIAVDWNNISFEFKAILSLQDDIQAKKDIFDELQWNLQTARDPEEIRFASTSKSATTPKCEWAKPGTASAIFGPQAQQQNLIDYLYDIYVQSPQLINEMQSDWLYKYIDYGYLQFFYQRFLQNSENYPVNITLKSLVTGKGQHELHYLSQEISNALKLLGFSTDINAIKDGFTITIEDNSIETILKSEIGIHMFHDNDGSILPISLFYQQESTTIVRSYAFDDKKQGFIADFKTGLINRSNLSAQEWHMLWYLNLGVSYENL